MSFLVFIVIVGIIALLVAASALRSFPRHMLLFWNVLAHIKQHGIRVSILKCLLSSVWPVRLI